MNGWRALCHAPTGTIFNRQGEELTIASEFTDALEDLSRSGIEWLDCEALERRHNIGRGSLIILDAVMPNLTASERYRLLIEEPNGWLVSRGHWRATRENRVYLMKQVALSDASHTGKLALTGWWQQMQSINTTWGADFYEGLVAKRADFSIPDSTPLARFRVSLLDQTSVGLVRRKRACNPGKICTTSCSTFAPSRMSSRVIPSSDKSASKAYSTRVSSLSCHPVSSPETA